MDESPRDVIDLLTHDHREVERLFGELEGLRGAATDTERARRKDLIDQVTIELVKHSVAEEAEVYPRVAEKVSADEAGQARHEHAEAEVTMKRLAGLQYDNASVDDEVATLIREIREHVAEEEGEIFPAMRLAFTQTELFALGARVERVKRTAPTRPHPSAPDHPPADKLLGPVAGLFDRLRDVIGRRGLDR